MSAPTRHQSGEWLGMVGNDLWLLTNAAPDDEIAARSWRLICAGAALHQLVAMYTERRDLTYALAGSAGEITQVVVRGPVRVEVATPAGTMIMAGAEDGGDWSGHVVPDPVLNVTLIGGVASGAPRPAAAAAPWLRQPPVGSAPPVVGSAPPVASGPVMSPPVVRAPLVLSTPPAPACEAPAAEPPVTEPPMAGTAWKAFETSPPAQADAPADADQWADADAPETGAQPDSYGRPAPEEPAAPEPAADEATVPESWASEPVPQPAAAYEPPVPIQPPPSQPVQEQPPPFAPRRAVSGLISDVSWADALAAPSERSGPSAPVPPAPDDVSWTSAQVAPPQSAGSAMSWPVSPPPSNPAPPRPTGQEPPAVHHTPAAAPFEPDPAPPPAPSGPAPWVEPFGNTTTRQDLDITIWRPIGQTSVMTGGGPAVTAVRRVDGHLNPLIATSCRVCAKAVPSQSSVIVPRPPLGVLRMSTSDTIRLDHGVIFGRDPGTPDASRRDQPYFVKLTDKDISRRHLEVVLDGWDVVVVDLNSSNGSAITMPGGVPEVIPGGARRLLLPGTIVHLSHTISFVFEVTP